MPSCTFLAVRNGPAPAGEWHTPLKHTPRLSRHPPRHLLRLVDCLPACLAAPITPRPAMSVELGRDLWDPVPNFVAVLGDALPAELTPAEQERLHRLGKLLKVLKSKYGSLLKRKRDRAQAVRRRRAAARGLSQALDKISGDVAHTSYVENGRLGIAPRAEWATAPAPPPNTPKQMLKMRVTWA